MTSRLLLSLALLVCPGLPVEIVPAAAAQTPAGADGISRAVERLRTLALAGDTAAINDLSAGPDDASVEEFVRAMTPAPTELVIKERDRTAVGANQRLLLEIFAARGSESRVFTWQLELSTVAGADGSDPAAWRVVRLDRLSIVTGLFRLALDASQQYDVRNLTVKAPDLTLQMATGTAFMASTPEGPTAIVLLGRGQLAFTPTDLAERTQVRIFSGDERLAGDFDAAFIRLRPSDFAASFADGSLTRRPAAPADARRAAAYFDDYIGRSLHLDLADLSRDRWSLVPQSGDVIAEIRTRRFGDLTYARAQSDAEDISFFDRRRRKNIAIYASQDKLASRGRFYSEDDLLDYDVLSYELEADFSPERLWLDGRASLSLRMLAPVSSSITLRIAETLVVRSVSAPGFGRLMHLRVVGQNAVIVNFPVAVGRGTPLTLQIVYGGRVDPQELDREAISLAQEQEPIVLEPEPRFIYSNRSYWYPQGTVPDYATARMQLTVPAGYDVVASGTPAGGAVVVPASPRSGGRPRRMFVFNAERPLRYLACVISRFTTTSSSELILPAADGRRTTDAADTGPGITPPVADSTLSLTVQANPRQTSRGRSTAERTAAIFQFYASLVGEIPYPSFTVALSESDLPGGHSPAYFAILNQTLPTAPFVWRNDPVSFSGYPSFFLAHELAHQWWGQAVGWKNYHEQWLSEGFAQYFAALYAEKERGADTFEDVLRQMRRWAVDSSAQGPVHLGYRLGHIKGDSRVFRAVIYNKAAMVLHMLRGLLGDDLFIRGIQAFYADWRFRKAGTDDFRQSMEKASGQDLTGFFQAWIHGTAIPRLAVNHAVDGTTLNVTIEHRGEVMPVPVTLTLAYTTGATARVVVPVTGRTITHSLPLTGTLRSVKVNEEHSLAIFEK
jgi:hypothetical protein